MKYFKNDLFDDIAKSSLYGNLGLFIGAGMSKAVMNNNPFDNHALSWGELLEKCVYELSITVEDKEKIGISYPDYASLIVKKHSQRTGKDYKLALLDFKQKIADETCWVPDNSQRAKFRPIFEKISPNWIVTTNYDLIIEAILTGKSQTLGPMDALSCPNNLIPIYHLHGVRTNPSSIVITQEDYIQLFRPNEYRQQKLPLLLKESTTIFIGYGLGDFNVLTALDWNQNVYPDVYGDNRYPNKVIQFLKTENPNPHPYITNNGIIVLEFDDLHELLSVLGEHIALERSIENDIEMDTEEFNDFLLDADDKIVKKFVDNTEFRNITLDMVKDRNYKVIGSFLEFFQRVIDEGWERTKPKNAFKEYANFLNILIDILNVFKLPHFPPALFDAIVFQFNRVAYYVGSKPGESYAALNIWNNRKIEIDIEVWSEIEKLSKIKSYYYIFNLPQPPKI